MKTSYKQEFIPKYSLTLAEQITEYLTNAIFEGRIKAGECLVENELKRKFNISRGPIREAFRVLDKYGLVVIIPRKGTFVREISQKDIKENFEIRACLEGLAARKATLHLSDGDIKNMRSALSGMIKTAENNDIDSHIRYHSEYHRIFIEASKNDKLIEIIKTMRQQAEWFRFSYLHRIQEPFRIAIETHQKIIDLFIKKDADKVEALVKEHILAALSNYLHLLESKEKESKETSADIEEVHMGGEKNG